MIMFCAIINLVFAFWHSFTRGARWHLCDLHLVRVETACVPKSGSLMNRWTVHPWAPHGVHLPRPRSHLSPVSVLGIRSSVWVHRQSCCTPFYTVHTHTHTHTTKLTFYAKTNPSTHMPAPAYAKRSRCPAPKLRSNKTLPPAPPYCCCNIRRADCPTLSSSSAWKDRSSG